VADDCILFPSLFSFLGVSRIFPTDKFEAVCRFATSPFLPLSILDFFGEHEEECRSFPRLISHIGNRGDEVPAFLLRLSPFPLPLPSPFSVKVPRKRVRTRKVMMAFPLRGGCLPALRSSCAVFFFSFRFSRCCHNQSLIDLGGADIFFFGDFSRSSSW